MRVQLRALLALLTLAPLAVSAQQITGVRVEPMQAAAGQPVGITIDVGARGRGGFTCGLSVAFGDGATQDIRVSENEVPLKITHTYSAPGNYSVAAAGKLVMRGIRSALPCDGSIRSAAVQVADPQAAGREFAAPPRADQPVGAIAIGAPVATPSLQGVFSLRAVHSGRCLDVTGAGRNNGDKVQQWECYGGDNQKWRFISKGADYYSLAAVHSNKCLDVEGMRPDNGVNVSQYDCHGGENQIWRVTPEAGGSYRLTARHSGKCLDVNVAAGGRDNGDNAQQSECWAGDNQKWRIDAAGAQPSETIPAAPQQAAAVSSIPQSGPIGAYVQRCADNPAFVTSLYLSIYKRQPDTEGHRYWVNALQSGMTREEQIRRIFDTPEYRNFNRGNRDYARDLYQGTLGREPDSGGHSDWTRAIDGGMSRAEVLRRFFESPEYQGIVSRCGATAAGSPATAQPAASCASEVTLYTNNNPAGVSNNPTQPTRFTLNAAAQLSYLLTYHWNNGRGQPSGTVGLQHQDGTRYGPWQAAGASGQGGAPSIYWIARPQVVLKPGTYTVLDSDAATWAQNAQSGGQGIVDVKGCAAAR